MSARTEDTPLETAKQWRRSRSRKVRVRLAEGAPVDRDAAVQALFDAGIGCSVHYIPLHQQPMAWAMRAKRL